MEDTNVIVRGMKMPKTCRSCPLHDMATWKCAITKQMHLLMKTRPKDCPLFEVKNWREI